MIRVKKVETDSELQEAFKVREVVFINEQECPVEEEFDGLDKESIHFIAYSDDVAVGTSRYRKTVKGIKLERFAVLKEFRGDGVGKRLVQTTLGHIDSQQYPANTLLYLHAQVQAMPLYSRHGFEKVGEKFDEVGIDHYEMRKLTS